MANHTTYLQLDLEECEALRIALEHWIDANESTILDDMEGSPRDERLSQLNYHVMLVGMYKQLLEKEDHLNYINNHANDWPLVPPLPPTEVTGDEFPH